MRKLLAFVLACGMAIPCVGAMAERSYVEGVYENSSLTVTYNEAEGDVATVAVYDKGKLCSIRSSKLKEGEYTFNISEEELEKDVRIFYYGDNSYPVQIVTPAPIETPTPRPTRTPYPEAYEKPKDAIDAPAIVDGVSEIAVNGEIYYELVLWFQGRKVATNVRTDVIVGSAPATMSALVGRDISCLQAGDVIHITCNMRGEIRSVEFVYRPDFANYFEDGISTAGIIGNDGYNEFVFGAVTDVYKTALEIGKEDGSIETLDVNPEAFVYKVEAGYNRAFVTLEGTGTLLVPEAYIPDENISGATVNWSGVTDISYVLARVARGVVTDIIVFE